MQEDNNDSNTYNMDTMQDMLFNRLKNLYLEEDEPYFMINYKPQPHAKCFLATDDINKHVHNGCLIFPKTFCRKLRCFAEPIHREQQKIQDTVEVFVQKLRDSMTQIVNKFAENLKYKLIPNTEPYDFLVKSYKGNYKEDYKLLQALEELIRKWNAYEQNLTLNSIEDGLDEMENMWKGAVKETETALEKMLNSLGDMKLNWKKHGTEERKEKIMASATKSYTMPKLFEQVDQVEINKEKTIPLTNGIDIHPSKNVYVAMGCSGGDLVIRDQDTSKEINRIKLNNNSSSETQNCLWSPSGDRIMVSTYQNHSIYIYDETGQKLLISIEKTYSKAGYGAIWLSEKEVIVGYEDGMVKFFNIDEGKEMWNVKINGGYARGMDNFDDSHVFVGDGAGSISNIDWRNNKIEWVKTGWHFNYSARCLRFNQDRTKLLTCSGDCFVKLMKLQDQSKLWEFKMNTYAAGISWVPGELYVIAISEGNQLVALNANNGAKMIEFNGLSSCSKSLRLNPRTAEVFVGDNQGTIRRLKIHQEQIMIQRIENFEIV